MSSRTIARFVAVLMIALTAFAVTAPAHAKGKPSKTPLTVEYFLPEVTAVPYAYLWVDFNTSTTTAVPPITVVDDVTGEKVSADMISSGGLSLGIVLGACETEGCTPAVLEPGHTYTVTVGAKGSVVVSSSNQRVSGSSVPGVTVDPKTGVFSFTFTAIPALG